MRSEVGRKYYVLCKDPQRFYSICEKFRGLLAWILLHLIW